MKRLIATAMLLFVAIAVGASDIVFTGLVNDPCLSYSQNYDIDAVGSDLLREGLAHRAPADDAQLAEFHVRPSG